MQKNFYQLAFEVKIYEIDCVRYLVQDGEDLKGSLVKPGLKMGLFELILENVLSAGRVGTADIIFSTRRGRLVQPYSKGKLPNGMQMKGFLQYCGTGATQRRCHEKQVLVSKKNINGPY